ncbi:MAG: DUF4168 domain-containing protein [Xenococcaceae cyanobacterium]
MGILWGVVPEFSRQSPRLTFSSSAYAQNFSDEQVRKYARAVLDIEILRTQALYEIQRILGQPPRNDIFCDKPDTFPSLSDARIITIEFCKNSKKIVECNGLSASEFNAITIATQSDENLKIRIRNEMIRIRKQPSNCLPD